MAKVSEQSFLKKEESEKNKKKLLKFFGSDMEIIYTVSFLIRSETCLINIYCNIKSSISHFRISTVFRRAPRLVQLRICMPMKYFRITNAAALNPNVHQSLSQLSLSLPDCEGLQEFISALPVVCPQLENIELESVEEHLRLFPAFAKFQHLRLLHVDCKRPPTTAVNANLIADDLHAISQHFSVVKKRPLESIRLTGLPKISKVSSFQMICKIRELIDLEIIEDFALETPQAEFDAAISEFACSRLRRLELSGLRLSIESHLLPALGNIAGGSLKELSVHLKNAGQLSDVACWHNFIHDGHSLTKLKINADITTEVFAELGRSPSLREIRCAMLYPTLLTAEHMLNLVNVRIAAGLQRQPLEIFCGFGNVDRIRKNAAIVDKVASAGITVHPL